MLTGYGHRTLLLVAAALLTASLHAATLPDFEAVYIQKYGGLNIGTSMLTLKNGNNGSYLYEARSWPNDWLSWFLKDRLQESSRGVFTTTGIRPESYHYLRAGGSKTREANLSFDWEAMTVINNVADSRWKMDIPAGTLDKLASQLGVMLALNRGETETVFDIADGGKLKVYRFKVIGRETLEVPAGKFDTVKITRVQDDTSREILVWCAPTLGYLPVRIWRREPDDSEYLSDLESFSESLLVKEREMKQ
jgi:hypothetical protein